MRTAEALRVSIFAFAFVAAASSCREAEAPPVVLRHEGAIAAGTPEAAEVGERILMTGGNAADAAVAVSLALAVTEPGQSGLGGSAVVLVRAPGEDPLILSSAGGTVRTADGLDVTLPALLPVLERLWRRHGSGTFTWEQLVEPAVVLAEDGFRLGRLGHRTLVQEYPRLVRDSTLASLFLTENRAIPAEGSHVTRPALAETLRRIARQGPADLTRGELANRLVAWGQAGGPVRLEAGALAAATQIEESPAVSGSFGEWTVWVAPEPFAGPEILSALRFLETAPPPVWQAGTAISASWTAEALAWAFSGSSPEQLGIHLSGLPPLPVPASDTAAARPPRSRAAPASTGAGAPRARPDTSLAPDVGGETTHFSILDGSGMAVAVTQSLGLPYGSAIAAADLGFVLGVPSGEGPERVPGGQPGDTANVREDTASSATAPTDRSGPRWMSPALVTGPDSLELLLGSPGGPRGVSAVVQVITAWTRAPRNLQEAVSAPRVHVGPGPGEGRGRLYLEGTLADPGDSLLLRTSAPWTDSVRAGLAQRGFLTTERDTGLIFEGVSPWFGGVNAVARAGEDWLGAADPRRDGVGRRVGDGSPGAPVNREDGAGALLPPP